MEFHSDNGGEFINNAAEIWCEKERLPFTRSRSRSHKKNGNCFAEQKNGAVAVVREYAGYDRLEGLEEQALLAAVYRPPAQERE
ncbi:MAG: hypothetical protein LBE17_07320 [Treponema sp.]|nr:hypothetical protein [Treponema sp.]